MYKRVNGIYLCIIVNEDRQFGMTRIEIACFAYSRGIALLSIFGTTNSVRRVFRFVMYDLIDRLYSRTIFVSMSTDIGKIYRSYCRSHNRCLCSATVFSVEKKKTVRTTLNIAPTSLSNACMRLDSVLSSPAI